MLGSLLSNWFRSVAESTVTDPRDPDASAESLAYAVVKASCRCNSYVAVDPEEHDETCPYVAIVQAIENVDGEPGELA